MTNVNLIAAQEVNFEVYKGDTFYTELTFTDANNNPVDFTGAAIKMQVDRLSSAVPDLELSVGQGITVSGTAHNILIIQKNPFPLERGQFDYDLQVTYPNGTIVTYLCGKINVIEDITK